MVQPERIPTIAIIAYPGVQMSAVLGLEDLFMIANRNAHQCDGAQLIVRQFAGVSAITMLPPSAACFAALPD